VTTSNAAASNRQSPGDHQAAAPTAKIQELFPHQHTKENSR